jgi:hypothetical protein
MPGVVSGKDRKLLTDAVHTLAEKYAPMFSTSQRCRSPHLNIDNVRDALFASNVLGRHSIKTAKELEQWMLEQNDNLKEKYATDEKARKVVTRSQLRKAQENNFYLGLDSSWYYN